MIKRIMLIDDDEDEHLIFTEAMKEIGESIQCFCSVTAEDGIKMLKQILPDFVFIDVNMPVTNGFECLEKIKQDEALEQIPVVIYSTGIKDRITKNTINDGAYACISKKTSITELASALKRILF